MAPAERRTGYIKVLARMDQVIAECESLLSESVLTGEEALDVAIRLDLNRRWRERTEKILAHLDAAR